MIDLTPAARRTAALLTAVPDGALGGPTPCEEYTLGDLVHHVGGLSLAFTWAATKDPRSAESGGPMGDGSRLEEDWRELYAARLADLAEAWRSPEAWTGMTRAGGVDLPGEVAGLVALNEVVVHGWDVARATGRPYEITREEAEACLAFAAQASEVFGPPVDVPEDASPLDRLVARTGRDPRWTP